MVASVQDPIALLRQMERASMEHAPSLPEETKGPVLWSGVGFRLADLHLVTPLGQISEVLPCPSMTPVPGTKSWVKGVANVRGNLLTIIDMAAYFDKEPIPQSEESRLLVMNVEGFSTGLLVDEVLGLRHFDEDLERQDTSLVDDPVVPHLQGAFLRDNVLWGIFDMQSLASSASFMHVAA